MTDHLLRHLIDRSKNVAAALQSLGAYHNGQQRENGWLDDTSDKVNGLRSLPSNGRDAQMMAEHSIVRRNFDLLEIVGATSYVFMFVDMLLG